ncbi:glycosyltransferase family 87 protein [Patescibacteria group bacterium]
MKKEVKLIIMGWLLGVLGLFLYSFTQIDLNLTLTRLDIWQPIQKFFQTIGYFQRPLSVFLYLLILTILFLSYFLIVEVVKKGRLKNQWLWILIFLTAGLLWLAYNAFSYDLFNYIFDAKIVTHYGLNPYQYRALDFPGEPMLGFMHWTHRLYPYGPSWLVFTIPLSFFGLQKFLPTMFLFKGLVVFSYLASSWLVFKLLEKTNSRQKWLGLAIFAFNPLIIIESLVSAHNDILMMALVLGSFYLLVKKKYLGAWGLFLLSVGVKFATLLLFPILLIVTFWQIKKKKTDWENIWLFSFFLMVLAVLLAVGRDELKPWYLLYPLSFLPLLKSRWFYWVSLGLSLGGLLYYAPFLWHGHWNPPVPGLKMSLVLGLFVLGLVIGFWQDSKGLVSTAKKLRRCVRI